VELEPDAEAGVAGVEVGVNGPVAVVGEREQLLGEELEDGRCRVEDLVLGEAGGQGGYDFLVVF